MKKLTWNEYLDEVIKLVRNSFWGVCSCNIIMKEKTGYKNYHNKLEDAIKVSPNGNEYFPYKWPLKDRQSRIDFLNSLKEPE